MVELNEAVQFYQVGDRPQTLQTLLSIADPIYPQSIQQEGADLHCGNPLVEGNVEGARSYFHEVLELDPDYNIDRFRHPPEVCMEFDYTNAQWKQRQPPPSMTTTNPVLSKFAPFGIYQFQRQSNCEVDLSILVNWLRLSPALPYSVTSNKIRVQPKRYR